MDVKLQKTSVQSKTRKLKGTWTVESREDYWFPLLNNNLVTEDVELSSGTVYLVDCSDCTQTRQIEIVKWLWQTFDSGYRVDEHHIVFDKPSHRTLMLMRWSGV